MPLRSEPTLLEELLAQEAPPRLGTFCGWYEHCVRAADEAPRCSACDGCPLSRLELFVPRVQA